MLVFECNMLIYILCNTALILRADRLEMLRIEMHVVKSYQNPDTRHVTPGVNEIGEKELNWRSEARRENDSNDALK